MSRIDSQTKRLATDWAWSPAYWGGWRVVRSRWVKTELGWEDESDFEDGRPCDNYAEAEALAAAMNATTDA